MTFVASIRQRGQITIPGKIRADLSWLSEGSIIHIVPLGDQSLVVRPYKEKASPETDWKKIWDAISLARSFKGKRGNLASFIAKDRQSHY